MNYSTDIVVCRIAHATPSLLEHLWYAYWSMFRKKFLNSFSLRLKWFYKKIDYSYFFLNPIKKLWIDTHIPYVWSTLFSGQGVASRQLTLPKSGLNLCLDTSEFCLDPLGAKKRPTQNFWNIVFPQTHHQVLSKTNMIPKKQVNCHNNKKKHDLLPDRLRCI